MANQLPTKAAYALETGPDVFYVNTKHKSARPVPGSVLFLVIHHTAGTDSRQHLIENKDLVSCHYLMGFYPDVPGGLRTYKFASEHLERTHTQGLGRIGPWTKLNDVSVSFEIEGPPFRGDVLEMSARVVAASMIHWRRNGMDPLIVGHKHTDKRKHDPAFAWNPFVSRVYELHGQYGGR